MNARAPGQAAAWRLAWLLALCYSIKSAITHGLPPQSLPQSQVFKLLETTQPSNILLEPLKIEIRKPITINTKLV